MDLVAMTRSLGKAIQASEEYKALDAAKIANDNDQDLQDAIGKFNLKRMEVNQAMSASDKDEAKTVKLNQEMQDIYQQIMSNPNMSAFNEAKTAMDNKMNEVTSILMMCVNGEDPDTCTLEGCGGSCSSCSGCH